MTRRISRNFQFGMGGLVVGSLLGIVGASLWAPSPGEAAAARSVPTLPKPTATVTKQVLRDNVVAPCSSAMTTLGVKPPPVASRRYVVTALNVATGQPVETGRLLGSVSGEPLVAFATTIPLYRDLSLGDAGPDVLALEQALKSVHAITTADSRLDGAAVAALNRLYAQEGRPDRGGFRLANSVSVPPKSSVQSVSVHVGQVVEPSAPLMTIVAGDPVLACTVPAGTTVSAGQRVSVEGGAAPIAAKVLSVSPAPDGAPGLLVRVGSLPAGTGAPATASVSIPLAATAAPVVAVPLGALYAAPDGSFSVRRVKGPTSEAVRVTIGLVAAGWVEVKNASLRAGEVVEVQADPLGASPPVGPSGGNESPASPPPGTQPAPAGGS